MTLWISMVQWLMALVCLTEELVGNNLSSFVDENITLSRKDEGFSAVSSRRAYCLDFWLCVRMLD